MAVVLNSEDNSYFSSSSLRRSQSQPKFVTQPAYTRRTKSSASFNIGISPPTSNDSSPASSPRTLHADSTAPSYNSTPASSSLSLDAKCVEQDEDQIVFPSYDDVGYYGHTEDLEPPPSPRTGDSYTVSTTSDSTSTNASRPESPDVGEHPQDDTAVKTQPSRHVDYLSHNWKEEDIWSSWKLIVSKRKAYANSARLENASWRTWMKAKNKLKTVSPETLNWYDSSISLTDNQQLTLCRLKDCDVTWLYGPLQTGSDKTLRLPSTSPAGSSRISKSNSFLQKKPILKKRSVSEIMLQRSLSSSSLLKQAAAAVQAQQSGGSLRPVMGRATSDYVGYAFTSRRMSHDHPSMMSSITSSGLVTPGTGERKHIHFNEQVEQCIALDIKGDDDEDLDPYENDDYDSSDSDDGAIMMKGSKSKSKFPALQGKRTTPRASFSTEIKTVAMLPSTTLKYRGDTPEPPETAMKHSSLWNGKLSPSPSQETLRPSKPSTRMLLGDAEDDDDEVDMDWQPSSLLHKSKGSHEMLPSILKSDSSATITAEPSGMRRTPSGMFMPYEEDEDDIVSEGLFGKVVDTVNTAKDIAHVIWNVGWRR